ncbi:MAG TPA: tetratricopeptide repeat protein [Myxococcaceae bacterium]
MVRSLLIVGCVLHLSCASAPRTAPAAASTPKLEPLPSADHLPYLSPEQIVERLESSKAKYRVEPDDSPPGGAADALWPLGIEPVDVPQVVVKDGRRVVQRWPLEPKLEALMAQAVEHYEAKRYSEAEKISRQLLAQCPDCYLGFEYLGQIALARGAPSAALEYFRQAARLNPDDSRLHEGMGSALVRLGRLSEAREALAWALVLSPRDPHLRKQLRNLEGVGLVFKGDVLIPRGMAYQKGEDMIILYDPLYGPAWLAFGACKALWHMDPAHRQEMTGKTEHYFNSAEDYECVSAAALVHEAQRAGTVAGPVDSTLDRLLDVIRDDLFSQMVLFETMARIHPQITLTLDDESRKRMWQFVLKHVLVPAFESRDADARGPANPPRGLSGVRLMRGDASGVW